MPLIDLVGLSEFKTKLDEKIDEAVHSKPFTVTLDTVTNLSGAYLHTTSVPGVTLSMKALNLDVGDSGAFRDKVTVTCNTDSVTLYCPEVVGTSSVTVTLMEFGTVEQQSTAVTSVEFDTLDARVSEIATRLDAKVNKPTTNGTNGQLLRTNGDGTTQWTTYGLPTDAQTNTAVTSWLNEHPEATTTVQDGSISYAKLDSDLKGRADDVVSLKSAYDNGNYNQLEIKNLDFSDAFTTRGRYFDTDGTAHDSNSWTTWFFDGYAFDYIEYLSAYGAQTTGNILMIAFFTSKATVSTETFISGVNFKIDGLVKNEAYGIPVPSNAACIAISSRTATGNATAKIVETSLKRLINTNDSVVNVRWRNGTVKNVDNANAIATKEIIPVYGARAFHVRTTLTPPTGYTYKWGVLVTSNASGKPETASTYTNFDDYSHEKEFTFIVPDGTWNGTDTPEGIAVALAFVSTSDSTVYSAIRIESVGRDHIAVTRVYENEEKQNPSYMLTSATLNIFDKKAITENVTIKQSDGKTAASMGCFMTDYIDVSVSSCLSVRANSIAQKVMLYKEDKTPIRYHSSQYYKDNCYGIKKVADAKYVRFVFDKETDIDDLMIAFTNETTGFVNDTWDTLFPNQDYAPFIPLIPKINIVNGKTIVDAIDNAQVLTKTVDSNTNEFVYSYTGAAVSGNVEVLNLKLPCEPYKNYMLEFMGKSSSVDDIDADHGAFFSVSFIDKSGNYIGNKFNSWIFGKSRRGYHRSEYVSPAGAKQIVFRLVVRGSTSIEFSGLSLNKVESYSKSGSEGIINDCHLGMTLVAPRNTMPAFELAKIAGFSSLIVNVNRTADDELVCLHNETIDETSDGTGNVYDFTYEQLLSYDFGSWFNAAYTGTKIPLFEDAVKFAYLSGMKLCVSLHGNLTNAQLLKMCGIIQKYGMTGKCQLKSEDHDELDYCYTILGNDAEYGVGKNGGTIDTATIDYAYQFGGKMNVEAGNLPTQEIVNYAISKGVPFAFFPTSDTFGLYKAFNLGVTRFTVDGCADYVFPTD